MSTNFDFNNADKQAAFELIPHGEIVPVVFTIRPGGSDDGGWLKQSQNNADMFMLDTESTVIEGEYAKRKIWQFMIVEGSEKAAPISRKTLRAIIEASKGINPDDMSNEAINARRISGWGDFNGLAFLIKVGIEKAKKDSTYSDKNKILVVITPDMPEYQKIAPPAGADGGYMPVVPAPINGGYQPKTQQQSTTSVVPAWLKKKTEPVT